MNDPGYLDKVIIHGAESIEYIKVYFDKKVEYQKLDLIDKTATGIAEIVWRLSMFGFGITIMFFLGIACALFLGDLLGNMALGFLSMAGLMVLLTFIFYKLRNKIFSQNIEEEVIHFLLEDS